MTATVVLSETFPELWADPKVVAAQCPDTFTYHDITVWNDITEYHTDDLVTASDGAVYRAIIDPVPVGTDPVGDTTASWEPDPQAGREQELLERAVGEATWVMWSMTEGVYHGTQCWEEDYRLAGCKLRLQRGPVTFVKAVARAHHCGTIVEPYQDWCLESANVLSFCCAPCPPYTDRANWWGPPMFACGCDGNVVRVLYEIGSNLPPGMSSTVGWLACEYGKAAAGRACSLPDRVTNITRQGVSWTVLDPMDFLDKGYSGMGRLDQWLAVARRNISGRFIDPMRGIRLFSKAGNCAGAFGDQDVLDPVPDPYTTGFQTNT